MSSINMKSIINKAKTYTSTEKFQKMIEQKADAYMLSGNNSGNTPVSKGRVITIIGIHLAAEKFIEVLKNEIASTGVSEGAGGFSNGKLGPTAVNSLSKLKHGHPYKTGKNKYQVAIWFADNLHRDSIAPDRYDGIDNIAALLNNGYTAGNAVYGIWRGHHNGQKIASLTERDGAHFIESAIRNYMTNFASKYGVVEIEVDDVYK